MKTTNINIPFDEEKLKAARYFSSQKGIDIEDELGKALAKLYEKCVPAPTREYIEQGKEDTPVRSKDKKPTQPKPAADRGIGTEPSLPNQGNGQAGEKV